MTVIPWMRLPNLRIQVCPSGKTLNKAATAAAATATAAATAIASRSAKSSKQADVYQSLHSRSYGGTYTTAGEEDH